METCAKCGNTGTAEEFVRPRKNRRPRCKPCDNEQQRESRYARLGRRRELGGVESYTCLTCGLSFERTVTPGNLKRRCDECVRAAYNERSRPKYRPYDLGRRYGITPDDYDRMLAEQGGLCAICRQPERSNRNRSLAVDHNHRTGLVRGLLCSHCNRAIGLLADDPTRLIRALAYLGATFGPSTAISWWHDDIPESA